MGVVELGVAVNQLVIVCYHLVFIVYTVAMVVVFPPVVTCPTLPNPDNGMVSVPTTTFGSTATYTCVTGYNGDTTRTCESDGTWSGSEPACDCECEICS